MCWAVLNGVFSNKTTLFSKNWWPEIRVDEKQKTFTRFSTAKYLHNFILNVMPALLWCSNDTISTRLMSYRWVMTQNFKNKCNRKCKLCWIQSAKEWSQSAEGSVSVHSDKSSVVFAARHGAYIFIWLFIVATINIFILTADQSVCKVKDVELSLYSNGILEPFSALFWFSGCCLQFC